MLVNGAGKVFVGKRIDSKGMTGPDTIFWQMPQGGIDKGEALERAMWRELYEETGVTQENAVMLKKMDDDIAYDLPADLVGKLWGGKYRGQTQSWFLLRFTGNDDEIDLATHDPAEFSEWKWAEPQELPAMIVPFKKRVYRTVLDAFQALI